MHGAHEFINTIEAKLNMKIESSGNEVVFTSELCLEMTILKTKIS